MRVTCLTFRMGLHVHPDLLATGLFSEKLEPLTELEESLTELESLSSRSSSPDAADFPEPLRKRARGDGKSNRIQKYKDEAEKLFPGFCLAKSTNWHLNEARRCETAFRGRVDQLCSDRLVVSKKTTPEEHLRLLKECGYSLVKVR